jgi:hypothetical protein
MKTGQTHAYQQGDDGTYQKGAAWPNPRFTAGAAGASNCVTDRATGLMWLKKPDATERPWAEAIAYCEGLNGDDGRGGYADWRLPNLRELESLVNLGEAKPSAWLNSQGFAIVPTASCWSSTTFAASTGYAWHVPMADGNVDLDGKKGARSVWPVRGG